MQLTFLSKNIISPFKGSKRYIYIFFVLFFGSSLNITYSQEEKQEHSLCNKLYAGGNSELTGYWWLHKDSSFLFFSFLEGYYKDSAGQSNYDKNAKTISGIGQGTWSYNMKDSLFYFTFGKTQDLRFFNSKVEYSSMSGKSVDSVYFSGIVTTPDGKPVSYLGVNIPKVKKDIITDSEGKFEYTVAADSFETLELWGKASYPYYHNVTINLVSGCNIHHVKASLEVIDHLANKNVAFIQDPDTIKLRYPARNLKPWFGEMIPAKKTREEVLLFFEEVKKQKPLLGRQIDWLIKELKR